MGFRRSTFLFPGPSHSNSLSPTDNSQINTSLPSSATSPTHKPIILVDVREPAELKGTGIIPSAVSIPLASQPDAMYLTADEFEDRFGFPKPQADVDGTIVFYCKAGVRARAAAQLAVQAGYNAEQIGVYEGSWLDWERNGGKVERWDGDDY
jgi:rhodanese-related sulfurtransferase